jgi:hypothetical protein
LKSFDDKLSMLVYEAIGEAASCWDFHHLLDLEKAAALADRLIEAIQDLLDEDE